MDLQNCISVIVPVYNAEPFLAKCIDSLLAQTYPDMEILLIDDGSTDASPTVCDRYAAADARVRVIHQKNAGVGAARNAGLDAAKGAYIAFVDADDYVLPDYLETLQRDMIEQNVDIVCCNFQEFYQGKPVNMTNHRVLRSRKITDRNICYADMVSDNKENYPHQIWAALWQRALIGETRFTSLPFGEDCVFNFEMLTRAKSVYLDVYAGYFYVRNDNSSTMFAKRHDLRKAKSVVAYLRCNFDRLPEDVPLETRQKLLQRYAWTVHYLAYALALSPDCRKLRSEYDPIIQEHLQHIQSTGLPLTGALKLYIALLRRSFGLYAALVRVWQFKIRLTEGNQT